MDHLLATAPRVAAWSRHDEHLIVDWSSSEPLWRAELPDDPMLWLLRVEGERRRNPSRAYNFALRRVMGEWLIRMDSDCSPTAGFDPQALLAPGVV